MKLPLSSIFQGTTVYHRTEAPDDLLQKVIDQHRRHHRKLSLTQQLVLGIAGPLIVLVVIWLVGMGGYDLLHTMWTSQGQQSVVLSGELLTGAMGTGMELTGTETLSSPTPLETEIFDSIQDIFTSKGALTSGFVR